MRRFLMFTCPIFLMLPSSAWAHALGAQWFIKGDKVEVEAYFSDDTPAQGALVSVFKEHDRKKVLVETRTDLKGFCSFALPEPGKYVIVVDAGAGHRKELALEIVASPAGIPSDTNDAPSARYVGPGREEFTSYPWRSVTLGVGSMGLIALVFWLMRRST
jgi:hypothetical protein